MARPTKFDENTVDILLRFIRAGFSVKAACKGAAISPDTCSRWRQKDPEFNRRFVEATKNQQWHSVSALAKYGCRTYKRQVYISPDYGSAPSQSLAGAFESHPVIKDERNGTPGKPTHYRGFPIRYGKLESDKPFEVCVVAGNLAKLQWLEEEPHTGVIITREGNVDTYIRTHRLGGWRDEGFSYR